MAEKRAHALERRLLTEQIEAEQRVIALLSHKMGTVTQAITDELPSVDELRLDMETAKQEINVLSSKYEQLIVLDDIATAAAVPAKSSAEKKKRVKSSSRQPSDDSDYSDSISSSEDDVEWVPSPQRRLQAAADRRKRAAERAAKQSTGSGRSSTGSDASQASDTITTSPTRTEEPVVKPEEAAAEKEAPVIETGPCKCKFMCVRFCGCRSGGRQCDETCGCKPGKCKNRPKLTAGSSASPVIPTSITVPVAADSVNSEDDFEFVPQPLTKAQEAVSSAPPAVGEDTRVAATEKDLENVINKAPSKMKKLFNPSAPAMVSLTVTEKRKLKAAVQGTADAPLSTTAALDL